MHFMKIFAGLVIATLASPGIRACAQAHVTENQTTYIYVDGKVGSDSNAGTQSAPLRTIQAAVNKASANNIKSIGTKVIINPGVYRESLSIQSNYSQTGATMTFQAAQTGTAVISGSDILTNWYQNSSNPAIYDSYWQYNFGNCCDALRLAHQFRACCVAKRNGFCEWNSAHAGYVVCRHARGDVLRQ